jgi:hypothetical protein
MKKWRLIGPSTQLIVEPASGARAVIRDTCADGAYRFHWSVIPSEESLPIAAGRTGGLARARSIAEEALRAYAEDWRGLCTSIPRQLSQTLDHTRQPSFGPVGWST